MAIKLTTQQFIEQAKQIHGDEYDYSQVKYVNTYTKVIVICPNHGPFEVRPNSHVSKKSRCPTCVGIAKGTTQSFIEHARRVHGDKYDYSQVKYVNTHTKVTIMCPQHGPYEMEPVAHISQKQGCNRCSYEQRGIRKRKNLQQFIEQAKQIHGDKYDYSLVDYHLSNKKIQIICKQHGMFEQTPNNHINAKQGCPQCWEERRPGGTGGYTTEWFILHPEEKTTPAILYVLEILHKHNKEHFIKIGVTKNTIKQRYARTGCGDKYMEKRVLYMVPTTLYQAYEQEQTILNQLKAQKFYSNQRFCGYTECLKLSREVLRKLERILENNEAV